MATKVVDVRSRAFNLEKSISLQFLGEEVRGNANNLARIYIVCGYV